MDSSLVAQFHEFFSVHLVSDQALRDQVYQVRYRVYCEEFGYESVDAFPDKKEQDDFDVHASHCLIIHKSSGYPAGCVRLIPAETKDASIELPMEKYCNGSLNSEAFDQINENRERLCEISRLAVDRLFRKRRSEGTSPLGNIDGLKFNEGEKRLFPMIAVSAFLATTALTELTGKTRVIAMMEPFLPRLLERSGLYFSKVGESVDYHGMRAPYYIETQSALQTMKPTLKLLYDDIHASIKAQY